MSSTRSSRFRCGKETPWKRAPAHGPRGLIRYGALKGYIDGFLMEQPSRQPDYAGDFTFRFATDKDMLRR